MPEALQRRSDGHLTLHAIDVGCVEPQILLKLSPPPSPVAWGCVWWLPDHRGQHLLARCAVLHSERAQKLCGGLSESAAVRDALHLHEGAYDASAHCLHAVTFASEKHGLANTKRSCPSFRRVGVSLLRTSGAVFHTMFDKPI